MSKEATLDFFVVFDYLEARSQSAAAHWEREILRTFEHLAEWPHSGHLQEKTAPAPLRVWPVDGYLVIYHPDTKPLTILAVLHGARDAASILKDRLP